MKFEKSTEYIVACIASSTFSHFDFRECGGYSCYFICLANTVKKCKSHSNQSHHS